VPTTPLRVPKHLSRPQELNMQHANVGLWAASSIFIHVIVLIFCVHTSLRLHALTEQILSCIPSSCAHETQGLASGQLGSSAPHLMPAVDSWAYSDTEPLLLSPHPPSQYSAQSAPAERSPSGYATQSAAVAAAAAAAHPALPSPLSPWLMNLSPQRLVRLLWAFGRHAQLVVWRQPEVAVAMAQAVRAFLIVLVKCFLL